MEDSTRVTVSCAACGRAVPAEEAVPADLVRPSMASTIRRDRTAWSAESSIC